jgi:hypothetical protein
MRLVHAVAAVSATLLLFACGGSTDTSLVAGPRLFSAEQVTGTWAMRLSDSLACADTLADSVITVVVTESADSVQPGGSLTFVSRWTAPAPDSGGPLYGTVDLATGAVALRLYRTDFTAAAELNGFVIQAADTFVGALQDPYAAYSPALLAGASCIFHASGHRASP